MMFGDEWRRPPMPAQFALRVAVLGGIGVAIFSIVFFRLWYLQVLSADEYRSEAQNNQVREITVQAPRGRILDREGRVLVDNRTALALQIRTTELPRSRARETAMLERLGEVADMSLEEIRAQIRKQTRESPASPVTLERDVPYELVYYLREHKAEFPGVSIDRVYVRTYPRGTLASHVLGYVREVDEEQLDQAQYSPLDPGDFVGKDGVEYTYDSLLRGVNGATRVQVDATGRPTGGQLSLREPQTGNDLRLSLDADVQETGEAAVGSFGLPGAFVVMDVHTGEMLGLGSEPDYDPSVFAKPVIPPATARQIFGDPGDTTSTGAPIFNRAMAGGYPTGSTFKPITALAGLDAGLISPETPVSDPGSLTYGGQTFENAGKVAHGTVDMRTALQVSSDVYFYKLGLSADLASGQPLQDWAADLGLGSPTGIDLPGEAEGLIPSPEWRDELYEESIHPSSPGGSEIVVEEGETDRPWSPGDNINLSVGQGDLQASPLQLAVAYATIANGGDVVRPHVGLEVTDPSGQPIQEIAPEPRRHVEIDPEWQDAILDGLNAAAMQPGGTSYAVFGGFPIEIAGKTGTAERPPYTDQSWYVALAPYPDPRYVVAVTIEQGGFGADAAAPATARILETLLEVQPRKIKPVPDPATTATGTTYD